VISHLYFEFFGCDRILKWILDVLTCNWLGIWLGMKTCEYFEMKLYCWRGINETSTIRGKFMRLLSQFTPETWIRFDWQATRSFKRWSFGVLLISIVLLCELNAFYLKYILQIPITHHLNVLRLVLHSAGGVVAVRQLYQYLTDPNCKSLGLQAWMSVATIFTESLICFKFSSNMFPNPCPKSVLVFWIVFMTLFVLITLYLFWPWRSHHHLEIKASFRVPRSKKAN
jgi:phosphatidylserine synthase 2